MTHNICNYPRKIETISCLEYPRLGHRVVSSMGCLLVIGGTSLEGQFSTTIIMINTEDFSSISLPTVKTMPLQGFSAFTKEKNLYVWGGLNPYNATNQLWTLTNDQFQQVPQNGEIPASRSFHTSVFINQRYLLLYGGWNSHTVFHTWHIFDVETLTWKNVKSNLILQPSENVKLVWRSGRGFLFVGSITDQQNFEIYEVKFKNLKTFQICVSRVNWQGQAPPPRCDTQIYLQGTKLYLLGGQQTNSNQINFLDDVWCLDVQLLYWQRLDLKLQSKCYFQIVEFGDKIVLVGGLENEEKLCDHLQIISFKGNGEIEVSQCKVCNYPFSVSPSQSQISIDFLSLGSNQSAPRSEFSISNNFFSKIAQNFHDPYQTLFYLFNALRSYKPDDIRVKYVEVQQDPRYFKESKHMIEISLTNSKLCNFKVVQLEQFHNRYSIAPNQHQNSSVQIKLACLAIGQTLLFTSGSKQNNLFVGYLSSKAIQSSYNETNYESFSYYNTKDKIASSKNDQIIIKQNTKSYLNENQYTAISNNQAKFYILNIHHEFKSIICQRTRQFEKKVPKLNQWAAIYYLSPLLSYTSLFVNSFKIEYKALTEIIDFFQNNNTIVKIKESNHSSCEHLKKVMLYKIRGYSEQLYLKNIYVYQNNRFIMKLPTKSENIWGFIVLKEDVNAGILKDRIINKEVGDLITSFVDAEIAKAKA